MGDRIFIKVERMAAGGSGLGRLKGQIVFLPGVLPGEEVEAKILESRSDYTRAGLIRVLKAHPERIRPLCRWFLECGGCQLMHAAYPLQTRLKAPIVLELLKQNQDLPLKVTPAPQALFYRDRVRFQLGEVNKRLRPGFFAAFSRRLVPVDFCYQVQPRINLIMPALSGWLAERPKEGPGPTQMEVCAGLPSEGFLVVLDFPSPPSRRLQEWIGRPPDLFPSCRVSWTVRGRLPVGQKLDPDKGIFWFLTDSGLILKTWPGVFTQVNTRVNQLLVSDVLELSGGLEPKSVLDLYSGLGNFSLPLAGKTGHVYSVEENPTAVTAARRNLRLNHIKNVTLIRQEALKAVRDLAGRGRRFDMIVMDPPRSGARGLAPWLSRLAPRDILYISCHPAALARDLAELASLGFSLKHLVAYDMFPQTAHLEVLTWLSRD